MHALQRGSLSYLVSSVFAAPLQMQLDLPFRPMEQDDGARKRRREAYRARLRSLAVIAFILCNTSALVDAGVGRGNAHKHYKCLDLGHPNLPLLMSV